MEREPGSSSIEKAWSILHLLASEEPQSLSEVASRLGIPKTSALRILRTLINLELVCYAQPGSTDKRYTVDYRALRIANRVLVRSTLRNQASPYLYALADQTDAIANLGVLAGHVTVIIEKVVLHVPFPVVHSEVGHEVPAHASSVGKVIMAYRPEAWVGEYLEQYPFRAITKGTFTDAEAFRAELERVRKTGYGVNNEESEEGVVSVAMPIYNHEGFCIAGLALSKEAHLHALPAEPLEAFSAKEIAALREAANRVSFSLGYHSKQFLVESAVWRP